MPRLRPSRSKRAELKPLGEPEMAICMEEFRPAPVAALIARGQQLPLNHPIVRAHPSYFRGLIPLEEVIDDGD
jgi:hypothetical protein